MYGLFFFFFFQAEDGIRDHCVTGVQTCALPIWRVFACGSRPGRGRQRRPGATPLGRSGSEERRVGKSVDLGGRRSIKKKKKRKIHNLPAHKTKAYQSNDWHVTVVDD